MYSIMNVIYGVPLTRKINALINEWEETDDDRWADADDDMCGFETLYHGSADRIIGFCGVCLGEFTECDEIIKIGEDAIEISEDLPPSKKRGPKSSKIQLKPSKKEIAEAQSKIDELDPEIKKILPEVGLYIITSTS